MVEEYTVADLNPRSQSVKSLESTLVRIFILIEAYEKLEPDEDWTDIPGATYRKTLGERYEYPRLYEECYNRWRDGTLSRQILDLAANLPPDVLKRKEIADGLARINTGSDRRGKGRADGSTPRRNTRRQAVPRRRMGR